MVSRASGRVNLIVRITSIVLPVLGLAFVLVKLWSAGSSVLSILDLNQAVTTILIGGAIFTAGNFIIVLAWFRLLRWFGETRISWPVSIAIYGRTQIAKYIPGNIFHYSSRHLMGYQSGLDHAPLLGAAVYEILGQLTTASLISLIGYFLGITTRLSGLLILLIFLLAVASPILIQAVISRFKFLPMINLPSKKGFALLKSLLPIWALYLLFYLIANLVFTGVVIGVNHGHLTIPLSVVFVAYTISWLAGFIAPGAPAGMGVREGVMILILTGYLGSPASVLISILSRFVTMTGDICFYLISLLFSNKAGTEVVGK